MQLDMHSAHARGCTSCELEMLHAACVSEHACTPLTMPVDTHALDACRHLRACMRMGTWARGQHRHAHECATCLNSHA
eukprot:163101-Chlamydomonas_euryale.AAC.5